MIETAVDSIRVSLKTPNERVVILKERDGGRYTMIWIGPFEAESIAMRLQGVEAARPLPYDLMKAMLEGLGAEVRRVEVAGTDNLFTATIFVFAAGNEMMFDARASDAINLAVRMDAPVFVDESLLMEFPSSSSSDAAQ